MALYPALTSVPYIQVEGSARQKVMKSNFDDLGRPQRKRKWLYPRRDVSLTYTAQKSSAYRELEQFWINRNGEYSSFHFIFPDSDTYTGEYVATGDGSTLIFNAPSKNASSITLYGDGGTYNEAADATSSGDYYLEQSGGSDGLDLITFFVAPNAGTRITYDFTGQLGIQCVFAGPIQYTRNKWQATLVDCTVNLEGLLINEGSG